MLSTIDKREMVTYPGAVLQVVQGIPSPVAIGVSNIGGSYATPITTANSTLAFSCSINLTSATSKVLVTVKVCADGNGTLFEEYACLFRGSAFLASNSWYRRVSGSEPQTHVITFLDSPGVAGTVQYDVRMAAYNGSYTAYINQFGSYSGGPIAYQSNIILQEIAG